MSADVAQAGGSATGSDSVGANGPGETQDPLGAGFGTSGPDAPIAEHLGPLSPSVREEAIAQYERVSARLLYAGNGEPFTLAVTSSVSGEGVSTVSLGLALSLATSTPTKVALVDANLRNPTLHRMLGLPLQPGLRETVEGNEHFEWQSDPSELFGALGLAASQSVVPNLWLVPSGEPMSHPAQLTTSEGAKAAIRGLKSRFGYVVIDCPPVLSAVDASSLCRLADGVVLVVRAGLTPRDDIMRARELLVGVPILGVILNGV